MLPSLGHKKNMKGISLQPLWNNKTQWDKDSSAPYTEPAALD